MVLRDIGGFQGVGQASDVTSDVTRTICLNLSDG
jgi:hypothetical protein